MLNAAFRVFAETPLQNLGGDRPHVVAALSAALTFADKSGKSIVIEPVGGELKIYDAPLGVMTNSPPFDWHMTNLRN